MATTKGSIEIINELEQTSDGLTVNTPDASQLPAALTALRGLTRFKAVDPVPVIDQEVGKFKYRRVADDEFERVFVVETVSTPVADAMWKAKAPGGADVTVYWREQRTLTPDEVAAAIALADVQAMRDQEA